MVQAGWFCILLQCDRRRNTSRLIHICTILVPFLVPFLNLESGAHPIRSLASTRVGQWYTVLTTVHVIERKTLWVKPNGCSRGLADLNNMFACLEGLSFKVCSIQYPVNVITSMYRIVLQFREFRGHGWTIHLSFQTLDVAAKWSVTYVSMSGWRVAGRFKRSWTPVPSSTKHPQASFCEVIFDDSWIYIYSFKLKVHYVQYAILYWVLRAFAFFMSTLGLLRLMVRLL